MNGMPFSKKENRSLLSKQIHKWDQDQEEEEEGGTYIISPEIMPELFV